MSGSEIPNGKLPGDAALKTFLAGEGPERAAWKQATASSAPPAALDAAILAQAEKSGPETAGGAPGAAPRLPASTRTAIRRRSRFQLPLALAATLVLGVGLVLKVRESPEYQAHEALKAPMTAASVGQATAEAENKPVVKADQVPAAEAAAPPPSEQAPAPSAPLAKGAAAGGIAQRTAKAKPAAEPAAAPSKAAAAAAEPGAMADVATPASIAPATGFAVTPPAAEPQPATVGQVAAEAPAGSAEEVGSDEGALAAREAERASRGERAKRMQSFAREKDARMATAAPRSAPPPAAAGAASPLVRDDNMPQPTPAPQAFPNTSGAEAALRRYLAAELSGATLVRNRWLAEVQPLLLNAPGFADSQHLRICTGSTLRTLRMSAAEAAFEVRYSCVGELAVTAQAADFTPHRAEFGRRFTARASGLGWQLTAEDQTTNLGVQAAQAHLAALLASRRISAARRTELESEIQAAAPPSDQ